MELLNSTFKLTVNLRGKDEFEIYKNYIHDLPRENIANCLTTIFKEENIKTKDDNLAIRFRQQGNCCYVSQNYKKSLNCYTKSLCYATCNGEQYSLAFANRAAAFYSLEQYQSCISDINLCLQANYPVHLQPKVYLRKARCLQKLGQVHEMRKILVDALNLIDCFPAKLKTDAEKYKQTIKDLIIAAADDMPVSEENFEVLPYIEPNSMFPNASASIFIEYGKQKGSVIAKKDIPAGEVLFVEKAYAFVPQKIEEGLDAEIHCQYCLLTLKSCVPCKTCTEHLYCNDNCRDCAWKEFHQWECLAVQASFKTCCADLAFRIILKALHIGFPTQSVEYRGGSTENGDKEDNYTYVYNLPFNIKHVAKETLELYVGTAGLLVNYLKLKTDFFHCMKQLPQYSRKNDNQLMSFIGGLMLRHCCQTIHHVVPVWDYDNDYYVPQEITIADAMCPLLKNMEHSCMPNTGYYFIGDTVVVKAITDIKNKDRITCSVVGIPSFVLEKEMMRQDFAEKYFVLKCTCQLCMDPRTDALDSYKCIKCEGRTTAHVNGNVSDRETCTCLECNYKFTLPLDFAAKKATVSELIMVPHNLDVINDCIKISTTIYTPFHSVFLVLYAEKAEYYKRAGDVYHFLENVKLLLNCAEMRGTLPKVKIGIDNYTNCVRALDMLQTPVKKINLTLLRKVLKQLTAMLNKSKAVFNLHRAPFLARLQTVEKKLRYLESSYILPGVNEM